MKNLFIVVQIIILLNLNILLASITNEDGHIYNVKKGKPFLKGYDLVSYFVDQKPAQGVKKYQTTHNGILYYFSKQSHLDLFKKDAKKYLPQFGGWCAYGMGKSDKKGAKFNVDPKAWEIVNDKLYLNYSVSVNDKWNQKRRYYLKWANDHWKNKNY